MNSPFAQQAAECEAYAEGFSDGRVEAEAKLTRCTPIYDAAVAVVDAASIECITPEERMRQGILLARAVEDLRAVYGEATGR